MMLSASAITTASILAEVDVLQRPFDGKPFAPSGRIVSYHDIDIESRGHLGRCISAVVRDDSRLEKARIVVDLLKAFEQSPDDPLLVVGRYEQEVLVELSRTTMLLLLHHEIGNSEENVVKDGKGEVGQDGNPYDEHDNVHDVIENLDDGKKAHSCKLIAHKKSRSVNS